MNAVTSGVWIADVDEVETRFETSAEVVVYLSDREQEPRGHLSILIDHGPVMGWRRFFGAKRDVTPCFIVEWDSGLASLIFLDHKWSEYRAIDETHPVSPGEEIRRQIAHGEPAPHPTAECMEKSRAFAAMRDFLSHSARPDWLTYRHVP